MRKKKLEGKKQLILSQITEMLQEYDTIAVASVAIKYTEGVCEVVLCHSIEGKFNTKAREVTNRELMEGIIHLKRVMQ